MQQRPALPASLVVVAVLFIISGVLAALQVIARLLHGDIDLNFGVLALFVGPGLLRLSRGWRTCGLVLNWIVLILFPILGVIVIGGGGSVHNSLGLSLGAAKILLLLVIAAFFALSVWIYYVLTRPDIRRLFGLQ